MKKNMIIGAIASIFAIGSAFATLAPETAYILGKTTSAQTTFACYRLSLTCDNTGVEACIIRVNTTLNGSKNTYGRRGPNCTPILTNTTATPIIYNNEVFYDVTGI